MQDSRAVGSSRRRSAVKIAYIVSAFPTITETFVLFELLAMEKLGVAIELYPLRRLRERVVHAEAVPWINRAHYHPFLSLGILRVQWHFLRRDARGYFSVLAEVLRGTWGSANFFFGAIAIFPKAVQFAYEMMAQGIEHVHAQFANHPAVAALIVHRLTGIPYSFTARGTDIHVDRHMLKQKLEAAEVAITVSSYNKKIMIEECGQKLQDKIHVVYGGVDVDRLSPRPKDRAAASFRILCVARFEEVKGHTYLVRACQLLRERGIDFECRLIGDGPLLSLIDRQVRTVNLRKEVRLPGPRTYREVIQELWWADVVALPTAPVACGQCEGIPNILKEAMACGLPVVASLAGGIPELVDDQVTGILVPPRDAAALADALQRLNNDSDLRRRLGEAGRQRVMREFNLKVSAAKRAELLLRSTSAGALLSDMHLDQQESGVTAEQSL